jgi:hypothetical protein
MMQNRRSPKSRVLGSLAAVALATTLGGCALSLRNPDIAELQRHPGRYQDRTVSVSGVVTSSWGVPLVPFRFYKVDDGTGQVTVLSQNTRMPATASASACAAAFRTSPCSAGARFGLHLREEDLYVRR